MISFSFINFRTEFNSFQGKILQFFIRYSREYQQLNISFIIYKTHNIFT